MAEQELVTFKIGVDASNIKDSLNEVDTQLANTGSRTENLEAMFQNFLNQNFKTVPMEFAQGWNTAFTSIISQAQMVKEAIKDGNNSLRDFGISTIKSTIQDLQESKKLIQQVYRTMRPDSRNAAGASMIDIRREIEQIAWNNQRKLGGTGMTDKAIVSAVMSNMASLSGFERMGLSKQQTQNLVMSLVKGGAVPQWMRADHYKDYGAFRVLPSARDYSSPIDSLPKRFSAYAKSGMGKLSQAVLDNLAAQQIEEKAFQRLEKQILGNAKSVKSKQNTEAIQAALEIGIGGFDARGRFGLREGLTKKDISMLEGRLIQKYIDAYDTAPMYVQRDINSRDAKDLKALSNRRNKPIQNLRHILDYLHSNFDVDASFVDTKDLVEKKLANETMAQYMARLSKRAAKISDRSTNALIQEPARKERYQIPIYTLNDAANRNFNLSADWRAPTVKGARTGESGYVIVEESGLTHLLNMHGNNTFGNGSKTDATTKMLRLDLSSLLYKDKNGNISWDADTGLPKLDKEQMNLLTGFISGNRNLVHNNKRYVFQGLHQHEANFVLADEAERLAKITRERLGLNDKSTISILNNFEDLDREYSNMNDASKALERRMKVATPGLALNSFNTAKQITENSKFGFVSVAEMYKKLNADAKAKGINLPVELLAPDSGNILMPDYAPDDFQGRAPGIKATFARFDVPKFIKENQLGVMGADGKYHYYMDTPFVKSKRNGVTKYHQIDLLSPEFVGGDGKEGYAGLIFDSSINSSYLMPYDAKENPYGAKTMDEWQERFKRMRNMFDDGSQGFYVNKTAKQAATSKPWISQQLVQRLDLAETMLEDDRAIRARTTFNKIVGGRNAERALDELIAGQRLSDEDRDNLLRVGGFKNVERILADTDKARERLAKRTTPSRSELNNLLKISELASLDELKKAENEASVIDKINNMPKVSALERYTEKTQEYINELFSDGGILKHVFGDKDDPLYEEVRKNPSLLHTDSEIMARIASARTSAISQFAQHGLYAPGLMRHSLAINNNPQMFTLLSQNKDKALEALRNYKVFDIMSGMYNENFGGFRFPFTFMEGFDLHNTGMNDRLRAYGLGDYSTYISPNAIHNMGGGDVDGDTIAGITGYLYNVMLQTIEKDKEFFKGLSRPEDDDKNKGAFGTVNGKPITKRLTPELIAQMAGNAAIAPLLMGTASNIGDNILDMLNITSDDSNWQKNMKTAAMEQRLMYDIDTTFQKTGVKYNPSSAVETARRAGTPFSRIFRDLGKILDSDEKDFSKMQRSFEDVNFASRYHGQTASVLRTLGKMGYGKNYFNDLLFAQEQKQGISGDIEKVRRAIARTLGQDYEKTKLSDYLGLSVAQMEDVKFGDKNNQLTDLDIYRTMYLEHANRLKTQQALYGRAISRKDYELLNDEISKWGASIGRDPEELSRLNRQKRQLDMLRQIGALEGETGGLMAYFDTKNGGNGYTRDDSSFIQGVKEFEDRENDRRSALLAMTAASAGTVSDAIRSNPNKVKTGRSADSLRFSWSMIHNLEGELLGNPYGNGVDKWRKNYIEQVRDQETIDSRIGSAAHDAIEYYAANKMLYDRVKAAADAKGETVSSFLKNKQAVKAIKDEVKENLKDHYSEDILNAANIVEGGKEYTLDDLDLGKVFETALLKPGKYYNSPISLGENGVRKVSAAQEKRIQEILKTRLNNSKKLFDGKTVLGIEQEVKPYYGLKKDGEELNSIGFIDLILGELGADGNMKRIGVDLKPFVSGGKNYLPDLYQAFAQLSSYNEALKTNGLDFDDLLIYKYMQNSAERLSERTDAESIVKYSADQLGFMQKIVQDVILPAEKSGFSADVLRQLLASVGESPTSKLPGWNQPLKEIQPEEAQASTTGQAVQNNTLTSKSIGKDVQLMSDISRATEDMENMQGNLFKAAKKYDEDQSQYNQWSIYHRKIFDNADTERTQMKIRGASDADLEYFDRAVDNARAQYYQSLNVAAPGAFDLFVKNVESLSKPNSKAVGEWVKQNEEIKRAHERAYDPYNQLVADSDNIRQQITEANNRKRNSVQKEEEYANALIDARKKLEANEKRNIKGLEEIGEGKWKGKGTLKNLREKLSDDKRVQFVEQDGVTYATYNDDRSKEAEQTLGKRNNDTRRLVMAYNKRAQLGLNVRNAEQYLMAQQDISSGQDNVLAVLNDRQEKNNEAIEKAKRKMLEADKAFQEYTDRYNAEQRDSYFKDVDKIVAETKGEATGDNLEESVAKKVKERFEKIQERVNDAFALFEAGLISEEERDHVLSKLTDKNLIQDYRNKTQKTEELKLEAAYKNFMGGGLRPTSVEDIKEAERLAIEGVRNAHPEFTKLHRDYKRARTPEDKARLAAEIMNYDDDEVKEIANQKQAVKRMSALYMNSLVEEDVFGFDKFKNPYNKELQQNERRAFRNKWNQSAIEGINALIKNREAYETSGRMNDWQRMFDYYVDPYGTNELQAWENYQKYKEEQEDAKKRERNYNNYLAEQRRAAELSNQEYSFERYNRQRSNRWSAMFGGRAAAAVIQTREQVYGLEEQRKANERIIKAEKEKQENLAKDLEDAKKRNDQDEISKLQDQIDNSVKNSNAAEQKNVGIDNQIKGLKSYGSALGDTFASVGQTIQSFASRIGYRMFSRVIQEAQQFVKQYDQVMHQIQAITLKSDAEMVPIRAQTISKAIGLKTSVGNVASVESALYRQGLSDQEVSSRTDSIIKFATVTGTKVESATKIITTALQNNLVTSAEQAMDALTALGDSAATTAEEIAKGMQKSAAAANTAGVSYKELTSMLTVITSRTQLGGTQAGTALQNIFNRMHRVANNKMLIDEAGEAVSVNDVEMSLANVGIALRTDKQTFRDTTEVLRDLAKVWNELNDIQRNNISYSMAGARQANMFNSLIQGLAEDNGEEFDRLLGLAEDSEGITQSKYEIMINSINASLEQLKSTFDSMLTGLSDGGVLTGLIDLVRGVVSGFADMATYGSAVVPVIEAIGVAVAALAIKAAVLKTVTTGAAGFLSSLAALGVLVGGVAGLGLLNNLVVGGQNNVEDSAGQIATNQLRTYTSLSDNRLNKIEEQRQKVLDTYNKYRDGIYTLGQDTERDSQLTADVEKLINLTGAFDVAAQGVTTTLDGWGNAIDKANKKIEEMKDNAFTVSANYAQVSANERYRQFLDQKTNMTNGIGEGYISRDEYGNYFYNGTRGNGLFDSVIRVANQLDYTNARAKISKGQVPGEFEDVLLEYNSAVNGGQVELNRFMREYSLTNDDISLLQQIVETEQINDQQTERAYALLDSYYRNNGELYSGNRFDNNVNNFMQILDTYRDHPEQLINGGEITQLLSALTEVIDPEFFAEYGLPSRSTVADFIKAIVGFQDSNGRERGGQARADWFKALYEKMNEPEVVADLYRYFAANSMDVDKMKEEYVEELFTNDAYFGHLLNDYVGNDNEHKKKLAKRFLKDNPEDVSSENAFKWLFGELDANGNYSGGYLSGKEEDEILQEILNPEDFKYGYYDDEGNLLFGFSELDEEKIKQAKLIQIYNDKSLNNSQKRSLGLQFLNSYNGEYNPNTNRNIRINATKQRINGTTQDILSDLMYTPKTRGYSDEYKKLLAYAYASTDFEQFEDLIGGTKFANISPLLANDTTLGTMMKSIQANEGIYDMGSIIRYIESKAIGSTQTDLMSNLRKQAGETSTMRGILSAFRQSGGKNLSSRKSIASALQMTDVEFDNYLNEKGFNTVASEYENVINNAVATQEQAMRETIASQLGLTSLNGVYSDTEWSENIAKAMWDAAGKDAHDYNGFYEMLENNDTIRDFATALGLQNVYSEDQFKELVEKYSDLYSIEMKNGNIQVTQRTPQISPMQLLANNSKLFTSRELSNRANELLSFVTSSGKTIDELLTANELTGFDEEDIQAIQQKYPELYEYLRMTSDQRNTLQGNEILRKFNLSVKVDGLAELGEASKEAQSLSDNLSKIITYGANSSFGLEASAALKNELYTLQQQEAIMANGTEQEKRRAIINSGIVTAAQYDVNPAEAAEAYRLRLSTSRRSMEKAYEQIFTTGTKEEQEAALRELTALGGSVSYRQTIEKNGKQVPYDRTPVVTPVVVLPTATGIDYENLWAETRQYRSTKDIYNLARRRLNGETLTPLEEEALSGANLTYVPQAISGYGYEAEANREVTTGLLRGLEESGEIMSGFADIYDNLTSKSYQVRQQGANAFAGNIGQYASIMDLYGAINGARNWNEISSTTWDSLAQLMGWTDTQKEYFANQDNKNELDKAITEYSDEFNKSLIAALKQMFNIDDNTIVNSFEDLFNGINSLTDEEAKSSALELYNAIKNIFSMIGLGITEGQVSTENVARKTWFDQANNATGYYAEESNRATRNALASIAAGSRGSGWDAIREAIMTNPDTSFLFGASFADEQRREQFFGSAENAKAFTARYFDEARIEDEIESQKYNMKTPEEQAKYAEDLYRRGYRISSDGTVYTPEYSLKSGMQDEWLNTLIAGGDFSAAYGDLMFGESERMLNDLRGGGFTLDEFNQWATGDNAESYQYMIQNVSSFNDVLRELNTNGEVSEETMNRFNEEFTDKKILNQRKYGYTTEQVANAMDLFSKDAKKSTAAFNSLGQSMQKIASNKYYADLFRSGDRSKTTLSAISGMVGLSEEQIKTGAFDNYIGMFLDSLESSDIQSMQVFANAFSESLEQTINENLQEHTIELEGLNVELAEGKMTSSGFDALNNSIAGVLTDEQQKIISMLQAAGVQAHYEHTLGSDGTVDVHLVIDKLGSVGGKHGGGGGGKSRIDKLIEDLNKEKNLVDHRIKMAQYEETKYENKDQLTNKATIIQKENELQQERIETDKKSIQRLREQQAATKEGSADWIKLAEAVRKYEEDIEEATIAMQKNEKELEEIKKKIRQAQIDIEKETRDALKEQDDIAKDMLAGRANLEQKIVDLLRARYQKEWDLEKETIEKKKQALEEEKALIDERLNRRKEAADEAEKYEELAEMKRQLALIEADSSRTREAKELREKIAKQERELGWDTAEEEAEYQKGTIDDTIQGYDNYISEYEEFLNDFLADANNFADKVNEVLEMEHDDLIQWLKDNDEEYQNSLEATQATIVQGWNDTWDQMLHKFKDYWQQVSVVMMSKEDWLKLMKGTDAYIQASAADQARMEQEWSEEWDRWNAYKQDDQEAHDYKHEDDVDVTGTTGGGGTQPSYAGHGYKGFTFQGPNGLVIVPGKNGAGTTMFASKEAAEEAAKQIIRAAYNTEMNKYPLPEGKTEREELKRRMNSALSGANIQAFSKGGYVKYTGLAMVHGTEVEPEAYLKAEDTALLRAMLDAARYITMSPYMSNINPDSFGNSSSININELKLEINEAQLKEDADYEEVARRLGESFAKELSKAGINTSNYGF